MKNKILDTHREWCEKNPGKKPNRAVVRMRWDDGENTDKGWQRDIIAIEENIEENSFKTPSDDCSILFYCKDVEGLLTLTEPENGSDFTVIDIESFYRHEN